MKTEIQEQLKQIELAMLKGTSVAEIVTHFAEVQKQFSEMVEQREQLETQIKTLVAQKTELLEIGNKAVAQLGAMDKDLTAAQTRIQAMEKNDLTWSIERGYAETMITTLKDIISAAMTRSALKGGGMFDFSGNLPGQNGCSSGYISGRGEAKIEEQVTKPEIK